ncbi:uncharacterized protein LOC117793426 [Drosophila innubila]|uniref:uncharacterized protein LOC117793426 n=1 Tax=Drosophila innubila TaxID=198719 RepID=UPI00148CCE6F|nr:uncharacterized protein LOC117793426 [Drosophila innubila]
MTFIWAIAYLLHTMIYQCQRLGMTVIWAYVVAISIEGLRIYCGFVLNLYPSVPHAKWLFIAVVALCLPLLAVLWYLRVALEFERNWIAIIWNMFVIFIGLEIPVVCMFWPKSQHKSRDWPNIESLLAEQHHYRRRR